MTESKGASATPSYQVAAAQSCELCRQARNLLEEEDGGRQKTHEAFATLARARGLLTPHASKAKKQLLIIQNELESMFNFFAKHPYDALCLSDNKNHSSSSIKKKYRRLVRKYHPDKGGPHTKQLFLAIKDAYDLLLDTDRRAAYHRSQLQNELTSQTAAKQHDSTTATRPHTRKHVHTDQNRKPSSSCKSNDVCFKRNVNKEAQHQPHRRQSRAKGANLPSISQMPMTELRSRLSAHSIDLSHMTTRQQLVAAMMRHRMNRRMTHNKQESRATPNFKSKPCSPSGSAVPKTETNEFGVSSTQTARKSSAKCNTNKPGQTTNSNSERIHRPSKIQPTLSPALPKRASPPQSVHSTSSAPTAKGYYSQTTGHSAAKATVTKTQPTNSIKIKTETHKENRQQTRDTQPTRAAQSVPSHARKRPISPPSFDDDSTESFMTAMMGGAFWGGAYADAVGAETEIGSEEAVHMPDGEAAASAAGESDSADGHDHESGDAQDDDTSGDSRGHNNLNVYHSTESNEATTAAPHAHTDIDDRDDGGGSPGGLFWGASPANHCASEPETSDDSVEEALQCSDTRSDAYPSDGGSECSEDFSPRVVDELAHSSTMSGYKVVFLNNGRPYMFEPPSTTVESDGSDHVHRVPTHVGGDCEEDLNAWRMRDTESSSDEDFGEEEDSIDEKRWFVARVLGVWVTKLNEAYLFVYLCICVSAGTSYIYY